MFLKIFIFTSIALIVILVLNFIGVFRKKNKYDKIINNILIRVKDIFNIKELRAFNGYDRETKTLNDIYSFIYKLEETSVDSGFITICIKKTIRDDNTECELRIDDRKVECSRRISKKFYKYFENTITEWHNNKKYKEFEKKYGAI